MSTDTQTTKRVSARIIGRVQGVGFRNFTQVRAGRLDVEGWVRNEKDGTVRLEAEGSEEALKTLLDAVREGPRAARVDDITVEWKAPTDEFETFSVRYV